MYKVNVYRVPLVLNNTGKSTVNAICNHFQFTVLDAIE